MANLVKENINLTSKHLKKGDPMPPYNGTLRLYKKLMCPYAQRVEMTLNTKGVEYEVVNIDLTDKPEWFIKKNPAGKVPCLEIQENLCITESLVIVEYLDDIYPQRPLLPKDPVTKAFDKIIVEVSTMITAFLVRILKAPETITEDVVKNYKNALYIIQEYLQKRGTKFLDGTEPGYADFMIWPWFAKMVPFSKLDERVEIDSAEFKLLLEYINNMRIHPIVKEFVDPDEKVIEYIKSVQSGRPNNEVLNK